MVNVKCILKGRCQKGRCQKRYNVKKGKPHPEPYLKAAEALSLKPAQCLVVENAPFGIESAKRAGMFCVAVATSLPKEYLKGADTVVDELSQITGIIEKSCKVRG